MNNNFNEFLNYIHRGSKPVIKSYANKMMKKITVQEIESENIHGDIYYVVNSGGDSDKMINECNAVFIDFDYGKDGKDFYPLDIVGEFKKKKIAEIKEFPLSPTFIIETRNGLHVYWVIDKSADAEQWKLCMEKLIAKFDSDPVVKNPARLMRLPFTNWMKDKDNPFYIRIVEFNDVIYDIEEVMECLKDVEINRQSSEGGFGGYNTMKSINTYSNITTKTLPLITEDEISALQQILSPSPITFETENEFYNHITQRINLAEYLGVNENESFNCIFHDDEYPSARIFISERGQYFYKCHSSRCGFKGNIIRCTEKIKQSKTRPDAINFIKKVYQLSIEDTEWQRKQKKILEENKRMIREGEFEEYYPDVYNLIKNYLDLLYLMHDAAIDNVYNEKLTDDENNVVFFTSVTKILEMLNYKNRTKISDRNSLFAFLKLINKLPDSQVPQSFLQRAEEIKNKHKDHHFKVNFFSIPSYCNNIMDSAEERANLYKDNNMSMRGWSRELLLRTYGKDIANEVYPQISYRSLTKRSNQITEEIHKLVIVQIQEKGYATEKEILDSIIVEKTIKGKITKTSSQTQIKKSLQEMLDTYGLERIRANKIIKEQYGVAENGYPFIIVKKTD